VLADFGIAASLTSDGDEAELFAMSVPWSSPEVLQERISGSVASEVWSLGATLYTLLAGHSPFERAEREQNTRDQITGRVIRAKYSPIGRSDVSERVEGILAKALDKNPEKRQESMHAFAEELRWAQYELGIAPTSLEVAAPEWASAAAPITFTDSTARGPLVSTVNHNSRRSERARKASENLRQDRDGLTLARTASPLKAAFIGAGVAVAVVVILGVVALFVFRVV